MPNNIDYSPFFNYVIVSDQPNSKGPKDWWKSENHECPIHFILTKYSLLDLPESLTDEDFKKLEIIKKAVLMSAEGREKRKERIKKYLNWVRIRIEFLMVGVDS